ncbi:MAG: HAD family hydrolase [Methanobrevibacter sp.]|nr:HAD family hydrolase [Methanobrevibacter sp.]
MKFELILFDLDDTLMAFDLVGKDAWSKAIELFIKEENIQIEKNILLDKIQNTRKWYWGDSERHKQGRKNIINARRQIAQLALKDFLNIDREKLDDLADDYTQIHEKSWYLFEDVEATLKLLKKKGMKLGIMTNGTSESQRGKLKRFDIEKYFDYFFIEGEVGYGKPDIRIYEYMLEETKIPNNKIMMVGDNLVWDIEPPKKLGIATTWINTKDIDMNKTNILPDNIIERISDVKNIIG